MHTRRWWKPSRREAARGTHFATALEVEVEVAEMLVSSFCRMSTRCASPNTGTEAAMAAFRLARGHTGRRKIIKFEGHYHGWWDAVLVNTNPLSADPAGPPERPDPDPGLLWHPRGGVEGHHRRALERRRGAGARDGAAWAIEAACVVTEGVMSNMGVIPPKPGYLQPDAGAVPRSMGRCSTWTRPSPASAWRRADAPSFSG
jgi:glutamate-1-semialdehyde 2,1-aminomutase